MLLSVYWIRCKWHTDYLTQGYVGVTNNIARRIKEHKRNSSDSSAYLKNAIAKYGEDIVYDILYEDIEEELALLVEAELRSSPAIGWNFAEGGGVPPAAWGNQYNKGRSLTQETKDKISSALKGRTVSDEVKRNMSKAFQKVIRKPLTEEHKRNIAKGNTGKKMSAEAIEKTRQANIGKVLSEETKNKIKQAKVGISLSKEHKEKISKSLTGKVLSEDAKKKIGEANSYLVDIYRKDTMEVVALGVIASKWCKENGYDSKSITRVAIGVRKSHKGLVAVRTK